MSDGLYLLDTSILLALLRAGALGRHVEARYHLRSARQRPFISIVSHGEIRVLARRNSWGEARLASLQHALDSLVTIDLNRPAVIDAYVELELVSQSHPDGARNMGKNDLWIAACARAAKVTLLTTDEDFAHLGPDHLDVEIIAPNVPRRDE
jgi:tRNA(fMet)-specific endonuclease VapC